MFRDVPVFSRNVFFFSIFYLVFSVIFLANLVMLLSSYQKTVNPSNFKQTTPNLKTRV